MKNKEIEEVLNELKRRNERYNYCKNNDISFSDDDYNSHLLLSYIEQLEQCYCNRTDCSSRIKDSKKYDSLLQRIEQLENNRDKAIEELEYYKSVSSIHEEKNIQNIIDKLKGDSE